MIARPPHRPFGPALLAFLALAGLPGCGKASRADWHQPEATGSPAAAAPASPSPDPEVTLAFAGDVHFAGRTASLLSTAPAGAFGPISQTLSAADVAMVNLETAVTAGGTPEPKQFHFRAPASTFTAVKGAGVDVVSIANNHALDYGQVGLADTLAAAAAAGVPAIGAGATATQAYSPWLIEVKGVRLAFLAVSQVHELEASWAARDNRPGLAMAGDGTRIAAAVRDARQRADFVIVYAHWGHEGKNCPPAEAKTLARRLAEAGADLVVGTHAHLLLGDGWLGRTYVAYGLGNFLWWRDDAYSNDTAVLQVTIREHAVAKTEVIPAIISRKTGQPLLATGPEEIRWRERFAQLRQCTGLADAPA